MVKLERHEFSIGLVPNSNGLVPNKEQTITWTNNDQVQRHNYASPGPSEFIDTM